MRQKKKSKLKVKKQKKPSDVKLFYIMPMLLALGVLLVVSGQLLVMRNNSIYRQEVIASSMKYGTKLPLWGGESNEVLTLGSTKLSKDGKTLAVEVKYDDAAHKYLSSFGNRYKLRLVQTKDNQFDPDLTYGLFGTDGSGVLTVHSKNGFKNKAFVVLLIDNGQLVTSDDLNSQSVMNDAEIDKSITAQLSQPTVTNNQNEDKKDVRLPPLYYIRLNAVNVKKSAVNWSNDKELVEDLFVNDNLKELEKQKDSLENKVSTGQKTLDEMHERLKENSKDNLASDNITDLTNSIDGLNKQIEQLDLQITTIKESTINKDVLEPKQTKCENKYTIDNLNQFP